MDQESWGESLDQCEGDEEARGRSLRQEWSAELRHEDIPGKQDTGCGQVNQQRVVGLASVGRVQGKLNPTDGQRLRLGHEVIGCQREFLVAVSPKKGA